jgi:6,7-dimethyl-8-ribityllumazine synthase
VKVHESQLDAEGLRVAIVVARFNHLVCARLLEGCVEELRRRGIRERDVEVAWVPGAFEIPLAASALAASGRYDALVALGVVVRGGTPHFEYVCRGVTDGALRVMLDSGVPVAFGVLTVDDVEQAWERTGGAEGHKGVEAAVAAIEMARLVPRLRAAGRPRRAAAPRPRVRR